METGYDSFFDRTMIIDVGFTLLSDHPGDTLRTVQTASIHLATGELTQSFPVRFYGLGRRYAEGDTLSDLSFLTSADAIVDTLSGSIERNLEASSQVYPIPASLAQRWIRHPKSREAIAIVEDYHGEPDPSRITYEPAAGSALSGVLRGSGRARPPRPRRRPGTSGRSRTSTSRSGS